MGTCTDHAHAELSLCATVHRLVHTLQPAEPSEPTGPFATFRGHKQPLNARGTLALVGAAIGDGRVVAHISRKQKHLEEATAAAEK